MPVNVEAVFRSETPARLRLWAVLAAGAAAALLLALTLVMAGVREQVRVIGLQAAPQAATAADLYFALSDLDAQVTRILLAGDSDELAGSRVDALGIYRDRGYQVDHDLRLLLTTDAEPAVVLRVMDGLTVYRQRVGQALTAPDSLGYWTQATNLLHLRILPDAARLREASTGRLDAAYRAKAAYESAGSAVVIVLGGALVGLLIQLQIWMARRFRRNWNPALVVATGLSVLLLAAAVLVLQLQSRQLADGRDDGLGPYLALSELRALGYDAAADTGRYLVSGNLSYYRDDFTGKAACLTGEAPCDTSATGGLSRLAGAEAAVRWAGYQRVHLRILNLADAGRADEATRLLTGIRRGDAAFDFAWFDASVAEVAGEREQDFARALRAAETTMTGSTVLPGAILTVVVALIPMAVRRRLAEYR
ncbi:hypothetical protein [Actinoplanes derwentensis]|uniref:hypothetical protein n=1 Tax=Actinoplanes derwentensis TaxID=113562 RepID=UPI001E3C3E9A|nr:hypothetical protein [Actinoplanes derwentensis]